MFFLMICGGLRPPFPSLGRSEHWKQPLLVFFAPRQGACWL